MSGGRLHEYSLDLCDYAVSHFRAGLRAPRGTPAPPARLDYGEWALLDASAWLTRAVARLPAPLADHVWAGVAGDRAERLLADAELDTLVEPRPGRARHPRQVPVPRTRRGRVARVAPRRHAYAFAFSPDFFGFTGGEFFGTGPGETRAGVAGLIASTACFKCAPGKWT